MLERNKRLEELDKEHLWHPFTQMKEWLSGKPVIIEEGRDCFIKDVYGRWYLDGVSSMWVNVHGHGKTQLGDAIKRQVDKISHSTLLGLGNVPAIELAEKLVNLLSPLSASGATSNNVAESNNRTDSNKGTALRRVFYSDNGSTAVEVALKIAFQYWHHVGVKGKTAFVALNNAYHGDTIGAMSVGGIDIFHAAFGPLLFATYKSPSPYCYRCELELDKRTCSMECLEKMEDILKENGDRIAAVIVEPLIQAAGGMITSPPGFLRGVRELCTRYGVLMIADEVATGFGRTGRMFACEHESVAPDIICLSKGITGGYLPLAATVTTESVFNAFLGEFKELKTFFHGHSYTGNPLGCACALACMELFESEGTVAGLAPKIELLKNRLDGLSHLPHVGDVRNAGLMAGVELVRDKPGRTPYPYEEKMGWKVALKAMSMGVFIRPLGNVIVIMPPLSIPLSNLTALLDCIEESIKEATA
ncbi:MAG: adenosylmethionine--8-amino-7-oxononanoate transaminase [Nitrospirae bacterium]|nr:adenosylmethionine--8-amino-7-oxononanoate transaminase [Nitrospirota bacterium]